MKIHTFEQYTPEWWDARRGVITASEVGAFVINTDKRAQKARLGLIYKKLAELSGHFEEIFPNFAMKRGTALEPHARDHYADRTGKEVREVGFIQHDILPIGCSPDGLIYDGDLILHGLEIKCPGAAKHIEYLMNGCLPAEYLFQVHMSMILAEVDRWDFYSYCPIAEFRKDTDPWRVIELTESLPPLHVEVRRDDFTDELEEGLNQLCRQYEETKAVMAEIYEKNS